MKHNYQTPTNQTSSKSSFHDITIQNKNVHNAIAISVAKIMYIDHNNNNILSQKVLFCIKATMVQQNAKAENANDDIS